MTFQVAQLPNSGPIDSTIFLSCSAKLQYGGRSFYWHQLCLAGASSQAHALSPGDSADEDSDTELPSTSLQVQFATCVCHCAKPWNRLAASGSVRGVSLEPLLRLSCIPCRPQSHPPRLYRSSIGIPAPILRQQRRRSSQRGAFCSGVRATRPQVTPDAVATYMEQAKRSLKCPSWELLRVTCWKQRMSCD